MTGGACWWGHTRRPAGSSRGSLVALVLKRNTIVHYYCLPFDSWISRVHLLVNLIKLKHACVGFLFSLFVIKGKMWVILSHSGHVWFETLEYDEGKWKELRRSSTSASLLRKSQTGQPRINIVGYKLLAALTHLFSSTALIPLISIC